MCCPVLLVFSEVELCIAIADRVTAPRGALTAVQRLAFAVGSLDLLRLLRLLRCFLLLVS